jgi:hypothetical protein
LSGTSPFLYTPGERVSMLFGAATPTETTYYDNVVFGYANPRWNVDSNGTWSVSTNWLNGIPNGASAVANFGTIITSGRNVFVDGAQTAGTLNFDNGTASYNLASAAGGGTVVLDNGLLPSVLNVLAGSHAISAPVTLNGNLTVNIAQASSTLTVSGALAAAGRVVEKNGAGAVAFANVRADTLNVNAGTVGILSDGTAAGVSVLTGGLSVEGGNPTPASATLDLNNNDLVVGPATLKSTVEAQVRNARNGGAWNRPGITSSAARANATTGLGVLSGTEYTSVGGTGTFSGQPYAASDTLVKYTYNGDANLDGRVTFDDYVKIDTGFNTGLTGWLNGDFNYSGGVSFDDYVLIDIAFNQQNGTLSRAVDWISGDDRSANGLDQSGLGEVIDHFGQFGPGYGAAFLAAVPEPSAAAVLLALGGATGLRLRRRRGA